MMRRMNRATGMAVLALCGGLLAYGAGAIVPAASNLVDTAQAATPKVGTYEITHMTHKEHSSYVGPTKISVIYTLKVHSYKNGKVKLSFEKSSCWSSSTIAMKPKTVAVKNGKSTFSFRYGSGYGYPIHGKAWVIYNSGSVKVKFKTTDSPEAIESHLGGHGSSNAIDTNGYVTIKRGSHKKYID